VRTQQGAPIGNATVSIRGEETTTDPEGHWVKLQRIHCAGWKEALDAFDKESLLRIVADRFAPYEEKLVARYTDWAGSCGTQLDVSFAVVMKPAASQ